MKEIDEKLKKQVKSKVEKYIPKSTDERILLLEEIYDSAIEIILEAIRFKSLKNTGSATYLLERIRLEIEALSKNNTGTDKVIRLIFGND